MGIVLHLIVLVTIGVLLYIGKKNMVKPWMYIIMTFIVAYNTKSTDRPNSELTYAGYYVAKEPLYALSIRFSNRIGLFFQQYFALYMCICVILFLIFVCRYTKHVNIICLLSILYPMPVCLSSIRSTLASLIVLNAIHLLNSNKKKDAFLYVMLVLFATTIHFSAILYLALLLANSKLGKKSIFAICAFLMMMGIMISFTDILSMVMPEYIMNFASGYVVHGTFVGFLVATVLHICAYIAFFFFFKKLENDKELQSRNPFLWHNLKTIEKINITSILFICLYCYSFLYFRRLYTPIMVLNYIVMVETLKEKRIHWVTISEKITYCGMFAIYFIVLAINTRGVGLYFQFLSYYLSNLLLKG